MRFQEKQDRLEPFYRKVTEKREKLPLVSDLPKQTFEGNIQFLQWPPNSPDLNPVEDVWQILKDYVEKKNPRNVEEQRADI